MSTRVYGSSDDAVYLEGECSGQVDCHGTDDREQGVLVVMSDGTLLEVKYGKNGEGIWEVKLLKQGPLFERIELCVDEDADPYSDVAHFREGIKWAYAATKDWGKVE